jgi:hypothetical protein
LRSTRYLSMQHLQSLCMCRYGVLALSRSERAAECDLRMIGVASGTPALFAATEPNSVCACVQGVITRKLGACALLDGG